MSAPARVLSPPEPLAAPPAVKRPLLERLALSYFLRRERALPPVASSADAVHILNEAEREALAWIVRSAVVRAAVAGALSAAAAALAETLADPLLGAEGSEVPLWNLVQFWSIVGGITVIASVIEIGFLYWDSLRSVHAASRAAGLRLFAEGDDEQARSVAAALARAALELPNPKERLLGIDPRREASRAGLLFAAVIYKLKIAATNFAVKLVMRRLLGRVLVRSALAWFAVPVTAIWNALVAWWVMREAKLRALGPSAIEEALPILLPGAVPLSPAVREAVMRAVAASIVRTKDLHPNLRALLLALHPRMESPSEVEWVELDDSRRFLAQLGELTPEEQTLCLRILGFAAIIDGRLTRQEARLVREARERCGRTAHCPALFALHRAFTGGHGIDGALLEQLS